MKAAVYGRFGPPEVVTAQERPMPVPGAGDVLIRVHAASALVPVIDACYPLERIADAYRHVDAGHKKGNVVVTMGG
jgi:NADPH:quinone reductase-like Zn-dependent oxidoreductase